MGFAAVSEANGPVASTRRPGRSACSADLFSGAFAAKSFLPELLSCARVRSVGLRVFLTRFLKNLSEGAGYVPRSPKSVKASSQKSENRSNRTLESPGGFVERRKNKPFCRPGDNAARDSPTEGVPRCSIDESGRQRADVSSRHGRPLPHASCRVAEPKHSRHRRDQKAAQEVAKRRSAQERVNQGRTPGRHEQRWPSDRKPTSKRA